MTSTSPLRSAPVTATPLTSIDGSQQTAQDTLKTLRQAVKDRSFDRVFACMEPATQARARAQLNITDPAVQGGMLTEVGETVSRITDQVRSQSPTEVTFKMAPEGSIQFAKFVLVQGKWYMA